MRRPEAVAGIPEDRELKMSVAWFMAGVGVVFAVVAWVAWRAWTKR